MRTHRWIASALVAAASVLLLASCSTLTRSLSGSAEEAPKAEFGPLPPAAPGSPAPAAPAPRSGSVAEKPKLYSGTGNFLSTKPLPPQLPAGPEEANLNFEALDMREAAKVILGDYLRESYTVHPAVTGNVTFRTIKPIPRSALLPTLEMLLRQNNAAVVREDGIYKVVPISAVRGSVSPQLGGALLPIPPGYTVLVVPVKYVGAREMAKILEPFAADNTVRVDDVRNLVILAGNQKEMRHLLDTIELFDVDWLSGYSVGIFPVRSADVKTLVGDLDKIFGPTSAGPLAGLVRVIPIERLNALLIVTTQPKYLETAKSWMERLDQIGGTSGGARLFVYQVRNGKAESLANLIGELFSKRSTTSTALPGLAPGARPAQIATPGAAVTGATTAATAASAAAFMIPGAAASMQGEVRVIADKDNNALLILASSADYEIIESALAKLDVIAKQVLVEVTIAEVTLSDDLKFGVDWFLRNRTESDGSITSGWLNTGSGLPDIPAGAVPAFSGLQLINRLGGDVRLVLNALGKDGRLQVLATPQLMVLDNQKAQIKVGDRISVQTQQQSVAGTTSGIINSFQYIETGILLTVTPRINSGGQVTLEVNQEVSVPQPVSVPGANPDISQRTATTTVVVASGEAIVLGGLIREDNLRGTAGLPLLSKIPVLGALFGTQTITKRRTELILLIRPVVLTNSQQAVDATEELRRKMPALEGFLMPRTTPPAK
ncbi:MAG: type II secretion system secretin GspD [Betaproteobacteria bacterium]|nr:type II secretion system secretin GspD [Betaproteobacteria bacterium]